MDNPRKIAKKLIQRSLPLEVWDKNTKLSMQLQEKLSKHPVNSHRIIDMLNQGKFDKAKMKYIHLEYRHAIVQIFTDALLMAQYQSKQLEPRLAPGSKIASRFLLTLNNLDEFGFRPGEDKNGYYRGNPKLAHYPLFEDLLDDYGITDHERLSHKPSKIAKQVRDFLEHSYHHFHLLIALLAVAEEAIVINFSPPLRKNTAMIDVEVNNGYYFVHGTSDQEDTKAYDDDHKDDLWFILTQAFTEDDYNFIEKKCLKYCDLWREFWDYQIQHFI